VGRAFSPALYIIFAAVDKLLASMPGLRYN
jgi:hypothetical protein